MNHALKRRSGLGLVLAIVIALFFGSMAASPALGASQQISAAPVPMAPAPAVVPGTVLVSTASTTLGVRSNCRGIGGRKVADFMLTANAHARVFINRTTGRVCQSLTDEGGDNGYQTVRYRWMDFDGLCNATPRSIGAGRRLGVGGTIALWTKLKKVGKATLGSRGISRTVTAKASSGVCAP